MNELPRQKLCELIAKYGESLCDEPGRCEGLLRDLCPVDRREVHVLVNALKGRVASDLRNSTQSVPVELTLSRLVKRLEDEQGLSQDSARWAVESWALALGKISEHDLSKHPTSSAPSSQTGAPVSGLQSSASLKGPSTVEKIPRSREPQGPAIETSLETASRSQLRTLTWALVLGFVTLLLGIAIVFYFAVLLPQQRSQRTTAQSATPAPTVQPTAVPTPAPTASAAEPAGKVVRATKEEPFVNSLGMKFVPVPGTAVLFSIWDTRVQDYDAFVRATQRSWEKPGFEQGPTHPAVVVSWENATAFCEWLTGLERKEGTIGANQAYRLPTDLEWSAAVGLEKESGETPEAREGKVKGVYPWGTKWPPPRGAGNYDPSLKVDDYEYTSPVGSFEPNRSGLYDMGGNVWQWCDDWWNAEKLYRVLRGASWAGGDTDSLLSSRGRAAPEYRDVIYGFRCVLMVESPRAEEKAKPRQPLSGKELLTLKGHSGWVMSVAFSPDGKRIVTGSLDDTVKVWDAESSKEMLTLKAHSGEVHSVAFSPDGERIVAGGYNNTAKVWDAHSGKELLALKNRSGFNSVAFSPDGRRIVTGNEDGTANVWDAESGKKLLTLKNNAEKEFERRNTESGHALHVESVAFSPDGRRIVTGSLDGTATVWDAQSGKELLTIKVDYDNAMSVAFSPDGRRIVTGGLGGTPKVWDAQSGKELLTPEWQSGIINSVAFSPEGRRFVTGNEDGTAKVWDAQSGKELLTLSGHSGAVNSVAFSPDGKRIVTGSGDKTAKVWDATIEE